MKKLLIGLFVMVTLLSVAQPSSSCLTCPPSGIGQSGKYLKSNGSKKPVYATISGLDTNSVNIDSLPYWGTGGNVGTSVLDFIGTTDAQNLQLKGNNNLGLFVDTFGSVSICDSELQDQYFVDSADGFTKFRVFAYDSPYLFKMQAAPHYYSNIMGREDNGLQYAKYSIEYTDTSTEICSRLYDDSMFYQCGIFYYTNGESSDFTGRSPELSIFDVNRGSDVVRLATHYNPARNMGYVQFHIDDSTSTHHEIHIQNNEFIPDDSIWNLGSPNHIWRHTHTYGLTIPTDAGSGKVLTSDANGAGTWATLSAGNYGAIPSYANNAAAFAALGAGKLYYTNTGGEYILKVSH